MKARPDDLGLSFVFLSASYLVKEAVDGSQVCQEEKMDSCLRKDVVCGEEFPACH